MSKKKAKSDELVVENEVIARKKARILVKRINKGNFERPQSLAPQEK